jgi:hypothetical protein
MKLWTLFVVFVLIFVGCAADELEPGKTEKGGTVLGETKGELDGEEPVEMPKIKEADAIQAIYGDRNSKPMRLVGASQHTDTVVDSQVGRVTEAVVVDEEAMCPVIFEAPLKKKDGLEWPNVPQLQDFEGREMRPVKIEGSNQGANWAWFTYLRGADCVVMHGLGSYWASDLQTMLAEPMPKQRRVLRAEVQCEAGQPGTCVVPIDDPRVLPESLVFLPVELAGRADLNFVYKKNGMVEERVKPPEGGWGLASVKPK